MCGKDWSLSSLDLFSIGSPPHVREGLVGKVVIFNAFRITPACAGRTPFQINNLSIYQDHPRMCGKDILASLTIAQAIGSPPHVREGLNYLLEDMTAFRITPACAGRTLFKPLRTTGH